MRQLTKGELDRFASRAGVKKVAVYNFLGTLGNADSMSGELGNLNQDARDYCWNAATVKAIEAGILLAYASE